MIRVIKKPGGLVNAYRLGDSNETIDRLMEQGRIRRISEDAYEIFSQEAVNGKGETARGGDYIKIDSGGFPYPNDREFFLANHRPAGGDQYEQIPRQMDAWTVSEPMCPEIDYLLRNGKLFIHADDPDRFYTARLWGTDLSAARDAVVVFYSVDRDGSGEIRNIIFNFVAKEEFDKTYDICPPTYFSADNESIK